MIEWIHKVGDGAKDINAQGVESVFDFPFPTGLTNHTLPVHIKKTTPTLPIPGKAYWEFKVQGHDVEDRDLVSRNGALHVIDTILDPRHKKHNGDKVTDPWADWEEWLPAWAEEA